jgi:hypothetical protein
MPYFLLLELVSSQATESLHEYIASTVDERCIHLDTRLSPDRFSVNLRMLGANLLPLSKMLPAAWRDHEAARPHFELIFSGTHA